MPLCFADPNNLYLAIVLLVVILFQAIFNTYQQFSSSQVLETFKKLLPTRATVLRDGQVKEMEASELAVGDIVKGLPCLCVPSLCL